MVQYTVNQNKFSTASQLETFRKPRRNNQRSRCEETIKLMAETSEIEHIHTHPKAGFSKKINKIVRPLVNSTKKEI